MLKLLMAQHEWSPGQLISRAGDHALMEQWKFLLTGRAGGNRMIISSMQKHSDHAGVQEQACGALANLGVHQQNMVSWQHDAAG